jgi:pilus assembly protein CpaB
MNRRLLSVFFFAVIIAGVTSLLLYKLLSSQFTSGHKTIANTKLVIATRDLQVGALIKDGDLQMVRSNTPAPDSAVPTIKDAMDRGVIATIYKGEPVIGKRLAPRGAGAGLAATIPVGMRAVALRVNDVVGLAGFVLPGMHVDVVVSGGGQENSTITRTVLQNIEVLSAGQHVERTSDNQPREVQVVNLLVNPDQAEVLSLVSNETKVQLVLRNPLDTQVAATQGTSIAKIFGLPTHVAPVVVAPRAPAPEPKVAKVEAPPTVEVFNGSKRSEQAIPGGSN